MIYQMECNECGNITEIRYPLAEHETLVKPGYECHCGGHVSQVFVTNGIAFMREPFPKNDPRWEHATDTPTQIGCKSQLKDICQQNGNISRYLEDAC